MSSILVIVWNPAICTKDIMAGPGGRGQYRKYLQDPMAPIPKTTMWRRKKRKSTYISQESRSVEGL